VSVPQQQQQGLHAPAALLQSFVRSSWRLGVQPGRAHSVAANVRKTLASTMHNNNANPQSFIENNLLIHGKAQTFQNEASARRPCRAECGLS